MRISDWSSDVCSSDLNWRGSSNRKLRPPISGRFVTDEFAAKIEDPNICRPLERKNSQSDTVHVFAWKSSIDRKSVASGKRVAVRVDLGGRRHITKTKETQHIKNTKHK